VLLSVNLLWSSDLQEGGGALLAANYHQNTRISLITNVDFWSDILVQNVRINMNYWGGEFEPWCIGAMCQTAHLNEDFEQGIDECH